MANADGEPQSLQNTGDEIATILVALDSSTSSMRILSAAARIARALPAATLHIVHVFRSSNADRARIGAPGINTSDVEDAKDQLAAHVRAAGRQCRNTVTSHFLIGDPTAEILKLAETSKADLLVVGTHDYKGFERFLLGSIAETLMRKAQCSVYIVRKTPWTHGRSTED